MFIRRQKRGLQEHFVERQEKQQQQTTLPFCLSTDAPTRDVMSGTLNVCEELNVNAACYVTLRGSATFSKNTLRYVLSVNRA